MLKPYMNIFLALPRLNAYRNCIVLVVVFIALTLSIASNAIIPTVFTTCIMTLKRFIGYGVGPAKPKVLVFNSSIWETCQTFQNAWCDPLMIILMETSGRSQLTPRQACAVESAALNNLPKQVTLFMTSSSINFSDPFMQSLRAIDNVQFVLLDLDRVFEHSPLENWYRGEQRLNSPYRISHLSDALRFLLLWRFGGIYLDLDVIVLRSLDDLTNCSGMEDETFVGAGVMAFEKNHRFIKLCLDEFSKNYRGDHWGYNGPDLFTRVLKEVCTDIGNLRDVDRRKCDGVDVLPPEAFYAIPWQDWKDFFEAGNPNHVISLWKNSYVIHVWNKFSVNTRIRVGSGQPYELAAKWHCPSVYSKLDGYF